MIPKIQRVQPKWLRRSYLIGYTIVYLPVAAVIVTGMCLSHVWDSTKELLEIIWDEIEWATRLIARAFSNSW